MISSKPSPAIIYIVETLKGCSINGIEIIKFQYGDSLEIEYPKMSDGTYATEYKLNGKYRIKSITENIKNVQVRCEYDCDLKFNPLEKTFELQCICANLHPIHISVDIDYSEFINIPVKLELNKFLSYIGANDIQIIQLPDYEYLQFKCIITKIANSMVEIYILNYKNINVKICGGEGDYRCQKIIEQSTPPFCTHDLLFTFNPKFVVGGGERRQEGGGHLRSDVPSTTNSEADIVRNLNSYMQDRNDYGFGNIYDRYSNYNVYERSFNPYGSNSISGPSYSEEMIPPPPIVPQQNSEGSQQHLSGFLASPNTENPQNNILQHQKLDDRQNNPELSSFETISPKAPEANKVPESSSTEGLNVNALMKALSNQPKQLELKLFNFNKQCIEFLNWIRETEISIISDDFEMGSEDIYLKRHKFRENMDEIQANVRRFNLVNIEADKLISQEHPDFGEINKKREEINYAWKQLQILIGQRWNQIFGPQESERVPEQQNQEAQEHEKMDVLPEKTNVAKNAVVEDKNSPERKQEYFLENINEDEEPTEETKDKNTHAKAVVEQHSETADKFPPQASATAQKQDSIISDSENSVTNQPTSAVENHKIKSQSTLEIAELQKRHAFYEKIFTETKYTDVILVNNKNEEVRTFRCFLAEASPIFKAIFDSKENEFPIRIEIGGFDFETMKQVVAFCQGSVIIGDEMKLLKFAKKYSMDILKTCCYSAISRKVTPENVCERIEFAYSENNANLKEKCLKVLAENKNSINQDSIKNLSKDIILDLLFTEMKQM